MLGARAAWQVRAEGPKWAGQAEPGAVAADRALGPGSVVLVRGPCVAAMADGFAFLMPMHRTRMLSALVLYVLERSRNAPSKTSTMRAAITEV